MNKLPDLNPKLNPEAVQWGKDVAAALRQVMSEQSEQRAQIERNTTTAQGASKAAGSAAEVAVTVLTSARAVPGAVGELFIASNTAEFGTNGLPVATVVLEWEPVRVDDAGVDLGADSMVTAYEVWENINTAPQMLGVSDASGSSIEDIELHLDAGVSYTLYARARTATANGAFSEPLVLTTATPTTPGLTPTTPTLLSDLGVVNVAWNGQVLPGPIAKPNWIDYVYVETAPASGGPWTRTGPQLRAAGSVNVTGGAVGSTLWARLKSVTTAGVDSAASTSASVVVQGVDLGSLDTDVQDAINQAVDAAEAAETAANGKNKITRSDLAASGTGTAAGDLWFQYLGNAVIGMWIWDGTQWVVQDVDGAMVANIDAGTITVGYLAGERIEVQSLGANQIAVGSLTGDRFAANTITANEIAFATLTGNQIAAGTIQVSHLEAGVGGALDLSANDSITFLVGRADDVDAAVGDVSSNLEEMQTFYQFGPTGAVVSNPSSPFAVAIRNDRIEMLESGVAVSYWNAGQMHVDSLVGIEVELGNHKIEKYGDGTVVRAL